MSVVRRGLHNRRFAAAGEAVSPVIGVILMVAITVVLAATVFMLVNGVGPQGGTDLPNMSFSVSESQDRATVRVASQDATWNQFQLRTTTDGKWNLNGDAWQDSPAGEWTTINAGRIEPGDYLVVCADVGGSAMEVVLSYFDANTKITSFRLNNVAQCPP